MLSRLISLISFPAALWMSLGLVGNPDLPPCLMKPDHLKIRLPSRGLTWLPGEDRSGICENVPTKKWIRSQAGTGDLFVYADGPSGSGRFWNVTAGIGSREQSKPTGGVCFTTSTVGWRTLQQYKKTPLPWLEDLDHDGKAQLIVWSSFPLHKDATMAEFARDAWVYRLTRDNSLVIDWELSRRLAREIAEAYRSPLDNKDQVLAPFRTLAAKALERFADQRCTIPLNDSH